VDRERLILPYLDIDLKYYDLGIEKRDRTDDKVTVDAANAIQEIWRRRKVRHDHAGRSPRRGIQAQEDVEIAQRHDPQHPGRRGVPRTDRDQNVPRLIPGWTDPIVVGRHAFGDQYKATDFRVPGPGKLRLVWEGDNGDVIDEEVFQFPAPAWRWRCTTSTIRSAISPAPR
jgi:isocitrate dehydrogenase